MAAVKRLVCGSAANIGHKQKLTIGAENLAMLDLFKEVGLLAIGIGGEALILRVVDGLLDGVPLSFLCSKGMVFFCARLLLLVASQRPSELGLVASSVVEVYCVA